MMTYKEYEMWFNSLKQGDDVYDFRGNKATILPFSPRFILSGANRIYECPNLPIGNSYCQYLSYSHEHTIFKEKIFVDKKIIVKKKDLIKKALFFTPESVIVQIHSVYRESDEVHYIRSGIIMKKSIKGFLYSHFKAPLKYIEENEMNYRRAIKNNKETILV